MLLTAVIGQLSQAASKRSRKAVIGKSKVLKKSRTYISKGWNAGLTGLCSQTSLAGANAKLSAP